MVHVFASNTRVQLLCELLCVGGEAGYDAVVIVVIVVGCWKWCNYSGGDCVVVVTLSGSGDDC